MSELGGVDEESVLCMHNSWTFLWRLSKNATGYFSLQFSFIFFTHLSCILYLYNNVAQYIGK